MTLEIEGLNAYYGKSHVINDLDLTIETGEAVAILGRNGAGKTSTIRSIMGVEGIRTEGSIRFDGTELIGKHPEDRANLGIGWVPENRRIFPNLTVRENLKMGALRAKSENITYEDMYALFPRLEERETQKGGTLSGGEQQMLAIARALLLDPELVLIDEPFEGLMPRLVRDIEAVLKDLRDRDYSILLVEQKPDETLSIADDAYIMETGQFVYEGTAQQLLDEQDLLRRHIGVAREA